MGSSCCLRGGRRVKLATFEVSTPIGTRRRIGVEHDGGLIDINSAYASLLEHNSHPTPQETADALTPPEMIGFLERGEHALEAAKDAVEFVSNGSRVGINDSQLVFDHDEIRLLAPLPRPNSIRDFMVFEEHLANSLDGEIPEIWYEIPVYYKGNPETVVHPESEVRWPSYTEQLDYELEIAAIIGKGGINISAEEASEHIVGYTIFNDFSARDIQLKEMDGQLGPTKGKDFANGFGPYLVTKDSLDIKNLHVRAKINGEVWSEGNINEMYHTFEDIVEYVSQDEPLKPGDVLGSGTVGGGCGLELDKWISRGDTVELEANGIGTLVHQIGT